MIYLNMHCTWILLFLSLTILQFLIAFVNVYESDVNVCEVMQMYMKVNDHRSEFPI